MASSKLVLLSPLQGWSAPLEETPDPVFSGRMMGDGVVIDPTGNTLHAPCAGTLIIVAASRHAVTLRADNGAEILLHVGIDTVGLAGEGFELHVRAGQRVEAGDRLITFDLDLLAQRAKSLMTPVLVTDSTAFSISRRSDNCSLRVGEFLMEVLAASDGESAPSAAPQQGIVERRVLVELEHGIHARPAATLAAVAKKLAADVNIVFGDRKAKAKSPVALMSLGVRKGDHIVIQASGADAESAVAAVEQAIAGGRDLHAAAAMLAATGGTASAAPARRQTSADPAGGAGSAAIGSAAAGSTAVGSAAAGGTAVGRAEPGAPAARAAGAALPSANTSAPGAAGALKGVVASRGLGVGTAFQFARAVIAVPEHGAGISQEAEALERARDSARTDLERTVNSGNTTAREIAEAHLALIDDPELVDGARALIDKGKSAGFAWRAVLRDGIEQLRALNDPRMAERADDLLDLETRVLSALSGTSTAGPVFPPETILIANELLPSQLVALDNAKLAGICLAAGGATSHVSIIAAAMDIPTIVAAGPEALRVPTGTTVILDAEAGWLYIDPPRMKVDLARSQLADKRQRRVAEQLAAQRECRTSDGTRIEVFANVGSEAEAHAAVRNGAEGSGLLRTEFLFLERTAPPDETEQLQQYQQIATALEGRPLTIRTLDIGGDKPIPYLPLPHEENPALGLRGVRTSLWRPDLLRIQLRAILRVRPVSQCRILLPMITDAGEIRAVRAMIDELRREEGREDPIAVGAMIETPASAVMADLIARDADFISVGTNDLTQYTLAMDRGHSELAARLDALHPAVLRLIAKVVNAGKSHDRVVAICGGLASDPVAVPILIGLGVHELSVVPAVIPQLKALISTLNIDDCAALANTALERETAEAVRALTLQCVSGLDATGRARE
ncbi:MAG: phosphoenolpyruvate--protein phosphotransferase [Proteobacteria bacterium]|nr:phosphoenolpyruvate--protein phosphotransferase [Pseudomonadota bacterium]